MYEPGAADRITESLRAAAGRDLSLDERRELTGYDLHDLHMVVGRLEEPRGGLPALAEAREGEWVMQPVGHRWDMAAQDPVSGEVAAYYQSALLRNGGTIEVADGHEVELRCEWLRASGWHMRCESRDPLARIRSRPGGGSIAGNYRSWGWRPRLRRIEVSLAPDARVHDHLGLLVLFACYVILVVESVPGYGAGGGGG